MRQLQQALVELIDSKGFNWFGNSQREERTVFERKDLPFMHDGSSNLYTINYMQVAYRMPETLANRLAKYYTKQYQKEKSSYPDVAKWYDQLSDGEKKKIKRYDYNNQKWF